MSKQRRTVSLEESVDEYLGREGVNASGLVNRLVKKHMNGTDSKDEIRQFRIEQVRSELENLESQMEQRRKELEHLQEVEQDRQDEQQRTREDELDDAARKLTPASWLSAVSKRDQIPDRDSDDVQAVYDATDVDMEKEQFYNEVVDRILTDE